jgi:hypothetical protein
MTNRAKNNICSKCGQPIREVERCGIRLTIRQARVFDAVKDAGDDGISKEGIMIDLKESHRPTHIATALIGLVNKRLGLSEYVMRSRDGSWFLCKRSDQIINAPQCIRLGMPVSSLKASIIDELLQVGHKGITRNEILARVWRDKKVTPQLAWIHIRQINNRLRSRGSRWRIVFVRRRWVLIEDEGLGPEMGVAV